MKYCYNLPTFPTRISPKCSNYSDLNVSSIPIGIPPKCSSHFDRNASKMLQPLQLEYRQKRHNHFEGNSFNTFQAYRLHIFEMPLNTTTGLFRRSILFSTKILLKVSNPSDGDMPEMLQPLQLERSNPHDWISMKTFQPLWLKYSRRASTPLIGVLPKGTTSPTEVSA